MSEFHVDFPAAQLAYKKGVIVGSNKVFDNGKFKNKPSFSCGCMSDYGDRFLLAPLLTDLQTELRENYNIIVIVDVFVFNSFGENEPYYSYKVYYKSSKAINYSATNAGYERTWNNVLRNGLIKALELLPDKE